MRTHLLQAPAAHYPIRPDHALAAGLVTMLALQAVCLLGWRWVQAFDAWRYQPVWLAACVAWVLAGWALWRWYRALPQGWLVWSGLHWRLEQALPQAVAKSQPGAAPQKPQTQRPNRTPDAQTALECHIALDLQSAMLLRLRMAQSAGQPVQRWVWLARRHAPQHWHAMRCALHASIATELRTGGTA